MAKLKIFYGRIVHGVYSGDGEYVKRAMGLMASTSQKKVADAVEVGIGEIRNFWTESGRPADVHLAMQHPEKLILIEDRYSEVPIVIDIVDNMAENRSRRKR